MKLLTIGIPTYNGAKDLLKNFDRCHIDNDEIEYLIIDDGSKDNTLEVANSFKKKYQNVKVIHQENKGFGGSYNTIFKNAQSDYLYILDCDDYLEIDSLKHTIDTIKKTKNANIDIYLEHFVYEKPNLDIVNDCLDKYFKPYTLTKIDDIKQFKMTDFIMNHNVIIKTKMLKQFPIVLPHCHYCDNLFSAYIFMHAERFYLINRVLCHYQIGKLDQSVSSENMSKNCGHHYMTLEATFTYINKEKYKSMSKYRQKHVYHYIYDVALLTLFSTFLIKSKENIKLYKQYLPKLKSINKYLYKKVFYKSMLWKKFVPNPLMYRFVRIANYFVKKKLAWQY